MSKEYGVYDIKEYEQCIFIGTLKEVSQFLSYKESSLRSYLTRKKTGERKYLAHRYELVEIKDEAEKEKEKNTYEIFEELLNIFRPPKVQFKKFDHKEWELKRIVKQTNIQRKMETDTRQ